MKIDRFNIPDFNSLNDTKGVRNDEVRNDFNARLESTAGSTQSQSSASPLQTELAGIAKATDFNNSVDSRVAIDQATRAIVSGILGPDVSSKIDMEAMMSAISDFAQNDPVVGQRLRNLLVRLS